MYPTAPKMIAGLLFATVSFFVTGLVIANIPSGHPTAGFGLTNALVGFLIGWRVVGRRAGEGMSFAAAYGLTAMAAIVFWCLLLWGGREMIRRSLDLYYKDPTEALQEMVRLMLDYAVYLYGNGAIGSMVIGAVFCGLVTEWLARRTQRPRVE
ncbi:TrgA family protein [Oceaniglobus roseus]|uniref:TrgA family protein n=1 Tax=Oceaniglobus roseus TaxID=1737570 RepID=UPI000C7F0A8C|nr:TrgA family protein [Kandeliimicrobium roseum]